MKFSVEDYCSKLGWYLVTIPAGTKGPTKFGWQQPEKALSDPDAGAEILRAKSQSQCGPTYMEPAALVLLISITSNGPR
jgi:hypothetical protein